MAYYSDEQTDRELARLERSITKEYTVAYKELKKKTAEYFEDFAVRDAQMKKALEDGTYPLPAGYSAETYYKLWRQNQLGRGARWEKLRDNMAKRITEANKVAAAYINDTTPGIYSLNYNYEAYQIEGITGAAFDIYNEQTVKQLIQGENHTEFRTVSINPVRDYAWNTKKINTALLSGIMQGKSIKGLADGFMTVMQSNRTAAVRNARTAVTSAQNSGRVETYRKAAAMGIEIKKRWLATEDERTRDSHRELDGVTVELDEAFPNGLQYPGDPKGAPAEVYNCRCTMLSILPKYNADLHNTENTVESYKEWLKERENSQQKHYTSQQNKANIKGTELQSDLGTFKNKLRADENIKEPYYNVLKNKFSHGSDDAKKLFAKYASGDTIANSQIGIGKTPIYRPDTKKIYMDYMLDSVNPRGVGVTYFHEHGHLIDFALNNISNDDKYLKLLQKDVFDYRNNYSKEHKLGRWVNVDYAISKELDADVRKYSAVLDLFSGITQDEISGTIGHDKDYWKRPGNITAEAFAHMYEAQFDKTRYAEMKKYFPTALEYFEQTIKEAAR